MSKLEETFAVERHREPSYRIIYTHGCRVIEGPIPVGDFTALAREWSECDPANKWVIDGGLALHLRASFVIGPEEATAAWRTKLRDDPATPPDALRNLGGVVSEPLAE